MKTLIYLWFLKTKGQLRYQFRKVSSALLWILMILVYGGIFLNLFFSCTSQPMVWTDGLSMAVLITLGFLALMLFTTLLANKKALFNGEDAYFLFTAPFSRSQVLSYLSFQTLTQSLMIGFFVLYLFSAFTIGLHFHWIFLLLLMSGIFMIIASFLVFTDYIYLLSIGDKKYKKVPYFILGVFGVLILGIFLIVYLQTGNIKTLIFDFIHSDYFYIVPFFGWLKMALFYYVEGNYVWTLLGMSLMVLLGGFFYYLLTHYKGDFYEQALNDGLELSKLMKEARAGKTNTRLTSKIKHDVQSDFKEGAYAIMSKSILVMKKTNQWITKSDLIVIGIYAIMTILMDMGFAFFVYMMIMYIFSSLQQSDLYTELQNYHIYLIPDKPIKKLVAVILPTFIKLCIVTLSALFIMGIYFKVEIMELFNDCVMMVGYISLFISSTILSLRLLKSRSNPVFANLCRMLLMLVCSLPSLVLIIIVYSQGYTAPWILFLMTYSSLIMNFVISIIILYLCKDMMNGRELKSE